MPAIENQESEIENPTAQLRRRISDHRAAVAARRARAYVDCPDYVLGLPVRPLTPATWTLLHATGNRLVLGGTPLEGDIRNYLWFHSRLFPLATRLPHSARQILKWLALLRLSAALRRRRDPDWYAATIATAGLELGAIIAEALADAPAADGRSDVSPGPCLQAHFEHYCARTYGWAPQVASAMPLRRLFQLLRAGAPPDTDDPEERAIRYDHLRQRNEALRTKSPRPPASSL